MFAETACGGNPVAVVLDGTGLTDAEMSRFARWTNLSETTFVLPPTVPDADYRVRIFTPGGELPFAGHPTLGTCHAWLDASSAPAAGKARTDGGEVVQECAAGLVRVCLGEGMLSFAAPPLVHTGPVDQVLVRRVADVLGIPVGEILDAAWADNGPRWVAVLLADAVRVRALRPGPVGDLFIGVVGPHPDGSPEAVEVRAFFPVDGATVEDPVTGSLNVGLAPWLVRTGRTSLPYTASQGTVLGRDGRVFLSGGIDAGETLWVGGCTRTLVEGSVDL